MLSTISNVSFITWLQHKHTCWQQESVSSRDGSVSIFTAWRYALRGRRNSVCHTRGLCPVSSVDMVRPTIMISSPYGINPNPLVYFDLWLCGEKLLLTLLTCTCGMMDWQLSTYMSISPAICLSYAFLNKLTDDACTTPAGRLFQVLITRWQKKNFLESSLDLVFSSFGSCPLRA